MNKFYRVPRMMHPYWVVTVEHDWPNEGDATRIAMNRSADTDMGNLYGDEFEKFFPNAVEITREEYENYD